jgi:hypothetical protein
VSDDPFVPTSVARRMIARMRATHERRRISIFSGPPGIGKTTAIDAFRALHPRNIVVVKIARRSAGEVLVLQHAVEAIRQMSGKPRLSGPRSPWVLRSYLYGAACEWAGLEPEAVQRGQVSTDNAGLLTFVFDEAQNLSRQALEAMRFWNDKDRCYAPFPFGLIFVGNSEFSLAPDTEGASVISAAVADRALYVQGLTYEDVSDQDLRMLLEARGLADAGAQSMILRSLRTPRAVRSLRRVIDMLEEIEALAGSEPITAAVVRQVMQPA